MRQRSSGGRRERNSKAGGTERRDVARHTANRRALLVRAADLERIGGTVTGSSHAIGRARHAAPRRSASSWRSRTRKPAALVSVLASIGPSMRLKWWSHQDVVLIGDAADQREVDRAVVERSGGLLQGQVELADARVADDVRALHIEIERDVKRRHVRQAAERQQRAQRAKRRSSKSAPSRTDPVAVDASSSIARSARLEGNVADRQIETAAFAECRRQ